MRHAGKACQPILNFFLKSKSRCRVYGCNAQPPVVRAYSAEFSEACVKLRHHDANEKQNTDSRTCLGSHPVRSERLQKDRSEVQRDRRDCDWFRSCRDYSCGRAEVSNAVWEDRLQGVRAAGLIVSARSRNERGTVAARFRDGDSGRRTKRQPFGRSLVKGVKQCWSFRGSAASG